MDTEQLMHAFRNAPIGRETLMQSCYFCLRQNHCWRFRYSSSGRQKGSWEAVRRDQPERHNDSIERCSVEKIDELVRPGTLTDRKTE